MKRPIKRRDRILTLSIGDCFKGGEFTISGPSSATYNGSNYYTFYERYDATNPSRMWIVKQTGDNIEINNVNSGTSNPDNLDHTTPIWGGVDGSGYIYVMQCDGWVQPIRVYKSSAPETITGTWTYVGDFDTNASYIWATNNDDITDMWFITRTGNAPNGYDASLLNVDLTDPTSYVKLQITEGAFATNQVRHYVMAAHFSGTSDYRCYIINHRNESTAINYKTSLLLHEVGTNNIHNFALTASKDVFTNGGLTTAELEADYAYKGTDSTKGVTNVTLSALQIDDDVYLAVSEPTGTPIYKLAIGSLTPTATNSSDWFATKYLYNTGTEILVGLYDTGNKIQLKKIQYDLTGYTFIRQFNELPLSTDFGLPYNAGDITGKFLVVGDAVSDGTFNVVQTRNLF